MSMAHRRAPHWRRAPTRAGERRQAALVLGRGAPAACARLPRGGSRGLVDTARLERDLGRGRRPRSTRRRCTLVERALVRARRRRGRPRGCSPRPRAAASWLGSPSPSSLALAVVAAHARGRRACWCSSSSPRCCRWPGVAAAYGRLVDPAYEIALAAPSRLVPAAAAPQRRRRGGARSSASRLRLRSRCSGRLDRRRRGCCPRSRSSPATLALAARVTPVVRRAPAWLATWVVAACSSPDVPVTSTSRAFGDVGQLACARRAVVIAARPRSSASDRPMLSTSRRSA